MIAICKQLKLKAKDGKYYAIDVVEEGSRFYKKVPKRRKEIIHIHRPRRLTVDNSKKFSKKYLQV